MNYRELKKLVDKDKDIFKNIYICNFFTCRIEKMEKTKSCKRKMRIAIGILLLEFAYMLFMGIGGVHATDETLPTVDGKLIHSIDHVEITSEMMNRYAKDMDPDIINRITEENGSCTPQEFLRAYTEQDPKFKKTLEKKYDITTQEDDFYDYR